MPNVDRLRSDLVNEFYDNSVMLNVAMNIEQFLSDEVLLYPYKNWFLGEIVSGPYIKRYNVSLILRYEYTDMPDPEGALVLKKFGVRTQYKKVKEKRLNTEKSNKTNKVYDEVPVWYIRLSIPREYVTDEDQRKELDLIDQMIDLEALETAADENMEQESGFESDNFGDDFGGDDSMADDFDLGADTPPDSEPEEE